MSDPDPIRVEAVERIRARLRLITATAGERVAGISDPVECQHALEEMFRPVLREIGADLGLLGALDVLDDLERDG